MSSMSTPALQRQPTTSSTMSSVHARTPSSAYGHDSTANETQTPGRFASLATEEAERNSIAVTSPILDRRSKDSPHSPASAATIVMPVAEQMSSPNLADDPVFRKQFEDKIASATADLSRNVSSGLLSRKNTRSKANNISNPKLISSSARHLPTTPIAGQAEIDHRTLRSDTRNDRCDTKPSATSSSPSSAASPVASRLRSFASLRRPERTRNNSQTDIPQYTSSGSKGLQRNASSSFRTLVGRLRSHKAAEPAFVAVAPQITSQGLTDQGTFSRQRPLGARPPVESVIRRTVILPQTWDVTQAPKDAPVTPVRKPSTRRKPVQRIPSVTMAELASRHSTLDDERQASVTDSGSDYQQDSAGSLVDMYLDDLTADEEEIDVQDGLEIWYMRRGTSPLSNADLPPCSEMSDGQVVMNVKEYGRTVEQHHMTSQPSAAASNAFQLSLKGAQTRAITPHPAERPETKVKFSPLCLEQGPRS